VTRAAAGAERVSTDSAESSSVFPSRYLVGLVVVLGAVFVIALAPREDTDLWWHLKDGAYIWSHHTVPTADFYSFTFAGHAWVDHEWLCELLLYGLYTLGGPWGPIVGFAAIICATFGLVYARMASLGVHRILGLFVLAAAFVASSATWGARPQMLTLFFLAVFGLLLERYMRLRDRRYLYPLPPLMVLWANLHGGWVLGIVLMGAFLVGEALNISLTAEAPLMWSEWRDLAVITVVTLAATFLNPNGVSEVLYPLVWITPTAYSNVLNEWVSPDFHQPTFMVFDAMLLTFIVALFVSRTRPNWTHIVLAVVFTHLALSESRNVAVWSVVMAPVLAFVIQSAIDTAVPTRYRVADGRGAVRPRTQRILNWTLLALVVVLYPLEASHFINGGSLASNQRTQFPEGAAAYLQHHSLPTNVFANYAWGGYLIWKLYPHYRDFIDGRANTLYDTALLNDYLIASGAGGGWTDILTRRKVGTVVVNPGAPLTQVLAENAGWKQVYADGTAVVFVRRHPKGPG
jgi:hypothetical protein